MARRIRSLRNDDRLKRVGRWLADVQDNARLLGHAAIVKSWDIAISVNVKLDNTLRKLQNARALDWMMEEATRREYGKRLRQLARGWATANRAIHERDFAALRRGALIMFDGALAAYSVIHHTLAGTDESYLATRHAFRKSLKFRRKQVSRELKAWPAHASRRRRKRGH